MTQIRPGKINPILIAFLIPLVVIVAAGVFLLARNRSHNALEKFSPAAYRTSPTELQGNHYGLDAQIDSQLVYDEGFGRVMAVKPLDGEKPLDDARLSVFIPDTVATDMHAGQRFHMKIVVKAQGLIQAEEMEKY